MIGRATFRCTGCGSRTSMTWQEWEHHHDHYVYEAERDEGTYFGRDGVRFCGDWVEDREVSLLIAP